MQLIVQEEAIDLVPARVARSDVPGGGGFVARFDRLLVPGRPSSVAARCLKHPSQLIQASIENTDWQVSSLGAIESARWPVITGWFLKLDSRSDVTSLLLCITGCEPVSVDNLGLRPDVASFLGSGVVHGFHVNLANQLGFAPTEGSPLTLEFDGLELAHGHLHGSPVSETGTICSQSRRISTHEYSRLSRGELPTGTHAPVQLIDTANSATPAAWVDQWHSFFSHEGMGEDLVSAWLLLEQSNLLGVPSLSQVPTRLNALANSQVSTSNLANGSSPLTKLQEMYSLLFQQSEASALTQLMASRLSAIYDIDRYLRTPMTQSGIQDSTDVWAQEPGKNGPRSLEKVCVAGLGSHRSGLGLNASYSYQALEATGRHVCSASLFPEPGGWNPRLGVRDGRTLDLTQHAVLLHLPIDRVAQSLAAQPALATCGRLIGYFMWETAMVPAIFERNLRLVDEIWTASTFVQQALQGRTDRPVHVTGHAVDVTDLEVVEREEIGIQPDAYVVHFSFDANSTVARKNPNAALDAFALAFDDDPSAVFLLKIRNFQQVEYLARGGCLHSKELLSRIHSMSNLKVITGEFSRPRTLGLLALADCYISLHRSEGFGYTIAEASALGVPIIATDYSGNVEYFEDRDGWAIPFELIPVLPNEYFYWQPGMNWAQADIAAAAQALREARSQHGTRPDSTELLGSARHSLETLSRRYIELLDSHS